MTGKVVPGSIKHRGDGIAFDVEDREGDSRRACRSPTTATIPDPFRGGREIVLTGAMKSGTFVGEPETLITKCPSKFTTKSNG